MTESKTAESLQYDSNPLTLSFEALGRFFKFNIGWAIVIISFAFFGFVGQIGQSFMNMNTGEETSSYQEERKELFADFEAPDQTLDTVAIIAIVVGVLLVISVFVVIGSAIGVYVQGMFAYVALASENSKSVGFSEAFQEVSKRFWRLFGSQLLASLKIFAWSLLFIIPGIIASLRYSMLSYVILSSDPSTKGVRLAHKQTKELVKKRLFEVFGVTFVGGLIPVIGSLVTLSGKAALHNQLRSFNEAGKAKPPIHWLNYLCLVFIAAFVFLIALIIGVIVYLAIKNS